MSPAPDDAIASRILAGRAESSNGAAPTIMALAHEAGVPRNALTPRHTDLKTEFYTRVRERAGTSEVEDRPRATITRLKNTIANKNTELKQLRADVPALVRTIKVLTLENQQLREAREQILPARCTAPAPTPNPRRIGASPTVTLNGSHRVVTASGRDARHADTPEVGIRDGTCEAREPKTTPPSG
ncbi:hypothetical protein [Amycolatopsis sp. NPDC052450]|uniref:hypothetical protein n=1 Tax=Amycolatopsis sp. NPDC052450 TaxID=3363937 RepID=UPI0037CC7D4B